MKKTKERTEREEATEKSQNIYANEITAAMRHQGSRFVMETSYVQIENLSFGRLRVHVPNHETPEKIGDMFFFSEKIGDNSLGQKTDHF